MRNVRADELALQSNINNWRLVIELRVVRNRDLSI